MLAPLLLMAAAGATVPMAPQPRLASLIPEALVPNEAIRKGKAGAVGFDLFIDNFGHPLTCQIDQIVGQDFSRLVCDAIMRSRFTPASDRDGKPAFGAYHGVVNFWSAQAGPSATFPVKARPDLVVAMRPDSPLAGMEGETTITVTVDGGGKVVECAPLTGAKWDEKSDVACDAAATQWAGASLENPAGTPRKYVRTLTMSFVKQLAAR